MNSADAYRETSKWMLNLWDCFKITITVVWPVLGATWSHVVASEWNIWRFILDRKDSKNEWALGAPCVSCANIVLCVKFRNWSGYTTTLLTVLIRCRQRQNWINRISVLSMLIIVYPTLANVFKVWPLFTDRFQSKSFPVLQTNEHHEPVHTLRFSLKVEAWLKRRLSFCFHGPTVMVLLFCCLCSGTLCFSMNSCLFLCSNAFTFQLQISFGFFFCKVYCLFAFTCLLLSPVACSLLCVSLSRLSLIIHFTRLCEGSST